MDWLSVVQNVGMFGVASGLLTYLIKTIVDQILARERRDSENRFTIGITSHMAGVAFDKNVEFCEAYAAAVNSAIHTLFRMGVSEDVLTEADTLVGIRLKWTLWMIPEVESKLLNFEQALRKIGANAFLLGELATHEQRSGVAVDRSEAIKEAYGAFAELMGWDALQGKRVTKTFAAEKIIEGLREVLGVSDLRRLRSELIKHAIRDLEPEKWPQESGERD